MVGVTKKREGGELLKIIVDHLSRGVSLLTRCPFADPARKVFYRFPSGRFRD